MVTFLSTLLPLQTTCHLFPPPTHSPLLLHDSQLMFHLNRKCIASEDSKCAPLSRFLEALGPSASDLAHSLTAFYSHQLQGLHPIKEILKLSAQKPRSSPSHTTTRLSIK